MAIYDVAPEARPEGIIRDEVLLLSCILAASTNWLVRHGSLPLSGWLKCEKHGLLKWAIVATENRKFSCLLGLQE